MRTDSERTERDGADLALEFARSRVLVSPGGTSLYTWTQTIRGGDFPELQIRSGYLYRVLGEYVGEDESLEFGLVSHEGRHQVGTGRLDKGLGALKLSGFEREIPRRADPNLVEPEVSWEWRQDESALHVNLISRLEGTPGMALIREWDWLIAQENDHLAIRWSEPSGLRCETGWLKREA